MTLTEEYLNSIGMPDGLQQLRDDDIKEILENQEEINKLKEERRQIDDEWTFRQKLIDSLKEDNKELLFKVQEEGLFGMKQVEINSKLQDELKEITASCTLWFNDYQKLKRKLEKK